MVILKWYIFILNTVIFLTILRESKEGTMGTVAFYLLFYYIPLIIYLGGN